MCCSKVQSMCLVKLFSPKSPQHRRVKMIDRVLAFHSHLFVAVFTIHINVNMDVKKKYLPHMWRIFCRLGDTGVTLSLSIYIYTVYLSIYHHKYGKQ